MAEGSKGMPQWKPLTRVGCVFFLSGWQGVQGTREPKQARGGGATSTGKRVPYVAGSMPPA